VTTRRALGRAIFGLLLTAPLTVYAQQDARVRTIGFLGVSRNIDDSFGLTAQFIATLRELGWIEGRNVAFLYRWTEQRNDLLPALARELVAASVQASDRIPIVMTIVADPVKFGLIASFAHPGGNVTGVAQPLVEWGKWLELAHEGTGGATRIAVIGNSTNIDPSRTNARDRNIRGFPAVKGHHDPRSNAAGRCHRIRYLPASAET